MNSETGMQIGDMCIFWDDGEEDYPHISWLGDIDKSSGRPRYSPHLSGCYYQNCRLVTTDDVKRNIRSGSTVFVMTKERIE